MQTNKFAEASQSLLAGCKRALMQSLAFLPQGRSTRWPRTPDIMKTWWRNRWANTTWQQRRLRGTCTALCPSTQPSRTRWASPPCAGCSLPTRSGIPTLDTVRCLHACFYFHVEWRENRQSLTSSLPQFHRPWTLWRRCCCFTLKKRRLFGCLWPCVRGCCPTTTIPGL